MVKDKITKAKLDKYYKITSEVLETFRQNFKGKSL